MVILRYAINLNFWHVGSELLNRYYHFSVRFLCLSSCLVYSTDLFFCRLYLDFSVRWRTSSTLRNPQNQTESSGKKNQRRNLKKLKARLWRWKAWSFENTSFWESITIAKIAITRETPSLFLSLVLKQSSRKYLF